jgi:hypothetical protein
MPLSIVAHIGPGRRVKQFRALLVRARFHAAKVIRVGLTMFAPLPLIPRTSGTADVAAIHIFVMS